MKSTGIVILAAGASTRLGEPKQNLEFRGKSLLNHAISVALDSQCEYIVVVTGAFQYNDSLQFQKYSPRLKIVHNTLWQEGIASSIRLGLNYLQTHVLCFGEVIFMVCDQPYVTKDLLNELFEKKNRTGKPIVACAYRGTLGTPVLFDQCYFSRINNLKGDEGAKKILMYNLRDVLAVPFNDGYLDIDTRQDFNFLLKLEEDKRNS